MLGWMKKGGGEMTTLQRIAISKIRHSEKKQRWVKPAGNDHLAGLERSIGKVGLIVPVRVKMLPDNTYMVVDGDCRLAACRRLGMEEVLAYVQEDAEDGFTLGLAANVVRENFSPLDVALAIKTALDEGRVASQAELVEILGFSKGRISQFVSYADLPAEFHELVRKEGLRAGGKVHLFTESVLRSLARLRSREDLKPELLRIAQKAIDGDLGGEAVELLVTKALGGVSRVKKSGRAPESKQVSIANLPVMARGMVKPGKATFEVRFDAEHPLRKTLEELAGVFQCPDFDPSSGLQVCNGKDSTPAFWDSGEGQDLVVSEDSRLAGSVGNPNGGEV